MQYMDRGARADFWAFLTNGALIELNNPTTGFAASRNVPLFVVSAAVPADVNVYSYEPHCSSPCGQRLFLASLC